MANHFELYPLLLEVFKIFLLALLCASLLFVALGWSEELQRRRDSRLRSRRSRRKMIPLSRIG